MCLILNMINGVVKPSAILATPIIAKMSNTKKDEEWIFFDG